MATLGVAGPVGMGGGSVGYAVRPGLAVTGGIDGASNFTLGWAGMRTPHRWHLGPRTSLAADGELGAGVGVGGANNCEANDDGCTPDALQWHQRLAGGGYLGAGGAFRLGPISLYSRGRLQLSGARHIPATQWATIHGGLHGHILERADIWAGVTYGGYSNGLDAETGLVTEVGLAFRFNPFLGWR